MKDIFDQIFDTHKDTRVFFSPGRVNLIGEHIDYNGGHVFPAAINLGTYGMVAPREDDRFRFYSTGFSGQGVVERTRDDLVFREEDGWANYAKGILSALIQEGHVLTHGFDLLVTGDLPKASGLSSSASLEVLVAYIANIMYDLGLSRQAIALLAQAVENDYMGMHCGIMDQLIIASGQKDMALLMNTATLETKAVPARFKGFQWVIMDTRYPRKTTESKYNERRRECEAALRTIQAVKPVNHLCELDPNTFHDIQHVIKDPILLKRARHAVFEEARTLAAQEALERQDAIAFGKLLDASHLSLKEDYEVTGFHLDTLVAAARQHGAIGARVTGAGFGGCAIALVSDQALPDFQDKVGYDYHDITGLKAAFYQVTFEDGVGEITI